jgi:phosphatidylinositol dimannoside acyltransferase
MSRWYAHRWNVRASWELILLITPRLPRLLLVPLQHATTLLFFACMPRERRAAQRNLRHVTGRSGAAALGLSYRLFYNFSRFMVAYSEMRHLRLEQFRERLLDAAPTERILRDLLREGRGIVLGTMHLGQWDLGLKLLSQFGVPTHVVMLTEDPHEVARYAAESRAWPALHVHQMGRSPLLAVTLIRALERGELVAIQLDRPVGEHVRRTPLFGTETDLPTGPVQLALASGAPLLPVFVLFDRGRNYRLLTLPPLRFDRGGAEGAPALQPAMRRMAEVMESVIARYPDQWFNFYDVWPAQEPVPR